MSEERHQAQQSANQETPNPVSASNGGQTSDCSGPTSTSSQASDSGAAAQQSPLISASVNGDSNGLTIDADVLGTDLADGSINLDPVNTLLTDVTVPTVSVSADTGLISASADTGWDRPNIDVAALGTDVVDASVRLDLVNGVLNNVSTPATAAQGSDSCGDAQQAALIAADIDADQSGVQIDAGAAGIDLVDVSVDGLCTSGALLDDILHA